MTISDLLKDTDPLVAAIYEAIEKQEATSREKVEAIMRANRLCCGVSWLYGETQDKLIIGTDCASKTQG